MAIADECAVPRAAYGRRDVDLRDLSPRIWDAVAGVACRQCKTAVGKRATRIVDYGTGGAAVDDRCVASLASGGTGLAGVDPHPHATRGRADVERVRARHR